MAVALHVDEPPLTPPAEALLVEVEPQAIIADKDYDADGFIAALIARRIKPALFMETSLRRVNIEHL